jgi:phosphate-selective porin
MDALERIILRLPKISGLVNLRFQAPELKHIEAGSFDIRRARLDFRGGFSSFDYRLQLEFANSPKVLDAYLTWKATPFLNVQAGQFKLPFSLENPYSPTGLETIDNSMVITYLVGYDDVSGIKSNGRDIGISVNGGFLSWRGFPLITYNAGIFNGSGINTTDNNRSKDFSGILEVHPINAITLSGSFYRGFTPTIPGNDHERQRGALSARYADARFLLRAEFIHATTGLGVNDYQDGYYIVGGYFICPSVLQVVAKYDRFCSNVNYTLGCNYSPVKNLRLMLNYSYKDWKESPLLVPPATFARVKDHQVAVQAMVSF